MASATTSSTPGSPGSGPSPSSPDYVAPPIPQTVKQSLTSWLSHPSKDTAAAELYLYRQSAAQYFKGAVLDNAPNAHPIDGAAGLSWIWERVKKGTTTSTTTSDSHASWPHGHAEKDPRLRATIATEVNPEDGKLGCIRSVDIGPDPSAHAQDGTGPMGTLTSWLPFAKSRQSRYLNMLEIGTPEVPKEGEEKVVLLHGYGAGTGFFFQNIASLASHPSSRLYALDWLGMGRSSRPNFHIPSSALKHTRTRVEAAEDFFVSALEQWRVTMGVEKMTLVGHSLGGYLSISYALRYPERVGRLVLVSPAGIPAAPPEEEEGVGSGSEKGTSKGEGKQDSMFKPKGNAVTRIDSRDSTDSRRSLAQANSGGSVLTELEQEQKKVAPSSPIQMEQDVKEVEAEVEEAGRKHSGSSQVKTQAAQRSEDGKRDVEEQRKRAGAGEGEKKNGDDNDQNPPRVGKKTRAVFSWLWERNLSPFGILRSSTFLAPYLAGRYTSRRFGSLGEEQLNALHAYCLGIFTAKGSGEFALAHLLAPGAYARLPMVDRIHPLRMPTSFIYGSVDWMSDEAGRESVRRLSSNGNHKGSCFVVPHAGHHVYLDNPKAFDRLVRRILEGRADGLGAESLPGARKGGR